MQKRGGAARGHAGEPFGSPAAVWVFVALGAVGCECESVDVREIGASRVVEDGGAIRWHATPAERFGLRAPGAQAVGGTRALEWELPAGWQELPPSSMRAANFRVDADGTTECYLTLLPGDAGGLAANVNRWRGQMSLPPASADEIAHAPRKTLLGREGQALLRLE